MSISVWDEMDIVFNDSHPAKAPAPIYLVWDDICTSSILLQQKNALSPIFKTLDGISILLRLWQPLKALSQIIFVLHFMGYILPNVYSAFSNLLLLYLTP